MRASVTRAWIRFYLLWNGPGAWTMAYIDVKTQSLPIACFGEYARAMAVQQQGWYSRKLYTSVP